MFTPAQPTQIETIQHSVDHDMQLIATPSSASRESVASSQGNRHADRGAMCNVHSASSAHSRATIDTRRYAKPAEQVIDKVLPYPAYRIFGNRIAYCRKDTGGKVR